MIKQMRHKNAMRKRNVVMIFQKELNSLNLSSKCKKLNNILKLHILSSSMLTNLKALSAHHLFGLPQPNISSQVKEISFQKISCT